MECGLTPEEISLMKFAFGFVIGTVLGSPAIWLIW